MWDMQEASGRYLITGLRVWKPRSKQKQTIIDICSFVLILASGGIPVIFVLIVLEVRLFDQVVLN